MMGLPPSSGAVQATTTDVATPGSRVAVTLPGCAGSEAGVTCADGVEAGPLPAVFVAVTVKV